MATKTNDILTSPSPTVKDKLLPRQYTEQQMEMIDELRTYAKTVLLPESDSYHPNEKKWLLEDEGCVPRYIRASKWRLEEAKRRITATLEWRRDYKPDLIPAEDVKSEAETGKILLNGFDNEGRPILYLRPGRENTKEGPRQIRHLVFHIERAIDFMPPHVESMVCLVDYRSATLKTSPSVSNARHFLNIVQNHYVERLGRAIVVNLPFLLNFFFKAISPFLDPVTRDKRFNPDLLQLIPAEQLDASLEGGLYPHEFEHETYWSQMCAHAGVRGDGTRFIPDWKQERGREREQEAEVKTDSPLESSEREEQLEGDDATECAGGDGRLHENGKIHGHGDVDYDVHVVPDAEASSTSREERQVEMAPLTNTNTGIDIAADSLKTSDGQAAAGVVDEAKLQIMREDVIAKYQQTQANLEKNREREDAGYSGGDRERGDDDEAKDAHTTGQC